MSKVIKTTSIDAILLHEDRIRVEAVVNLYVHTRRGLSYGTRLYVGSRDTESHRTKGKQCSQKDDTCAKLGERTPVASFDSCTAPNPPSEFALFPAQTTAVVNPCKVSAASICARGSS